LEKREFRIVIVRFKDKNQMYLVSEILNGKVFIMPKPRRGDWLEDEILRFKKEGINCLVSLLTLSEERELGLELEKQIALNNGIKFFSFPIPDRDIPSSKNDFIVFISSLYDELENGHSLAVHCRAGIGRAGITVVSLLIVSGLSSEDAFELVSKARGFSVPDTPEQKRWVELIEDNLIKIKS
jgi:protein-tyrosine phosphatase